MTLADLTENLRTAVNAGTPLSKSLKFDLMGDGFIHISGHDVTNEDGPADLTMTLSLDDLKAMGKGELDPMMAVMSGRLKLSDMMAAMSMQPEINGLMSRIK